MSKLKLPGWMKRILKDFFRKEFIPIKILFFVISGASSAMFPFLTIQARSLGINEKELGIIFGFNPVIAVLGPPLTGMIADRIGNFKFFLAFTLAASGFAALTFLYIPQGRIDHKLPQDLPLTLTCGGPLGVEPDLSLDLPYRCDFLDDLEMVNVTLQNCTLCATNRSLPFVAEKERKLCAENGSTSDGCHISQHLSNVTHLMTAIPLFKEAERNISRLQVLDWSCPQVSLDAIDLAVADSIAHSADSNSTQHGAIDCTMQCQATIPRDDLCSNKITQEDLNPTWTFWSYLFVRLLNTLTLATSFTLFDGAAIAVVKEHKGDYGFQRVYGNLGGIVFTPIVGQLIDYYSRFSNTEDYRPTFYLCCLLKLIAAVIVLFVDLDFRQPSTRVLKDFRSLIKQPEIVSFLIVMLIAGTCFGLLETFLFWLLQDLGASKFLMGITITVGSIAGLPILIASSSIFKKLGHVNTIILGVLAYVVRFLGYSFLTNAWWCMPFEAFECFTVSLISAAAVTYAADLATPATLATLQGTFGSLHFGVGRGSGSLLGGFLLKPIGVRNTFRIMAGVSAITGIVYFIINKIFFQSLQDERRKIADLEKKKKKKEEESGDTVTPSQEKHNGVIENGVKMTDRENVSIENIKSKESGSGKEVCNAGFVEDE